MNTPVIPFSASRPLPFGAVLWGFVAIFFFALSAVDQDSRNLLLVGLLPLGWSVAGWMARPHRLEAELTPTGIKVVEQGLEIPYHTIIGVTAPQRNPKKPERKNYPIAIHHADGILLIPQRLNPSSETLLQALLARIPQSSQSLVNLALREHHQGQVDTFGEGRVFTYNALTLKRRGASNRKAMRYYSLAALLVSIVWIVVAATMMEVPKVKEGFLGAGFSFGFFALLFFVASFSHTRPLGISKPEESSLVISPVGIAMVQGNIKGVLNWNQLLDVVYRPRGADFRLSSSSDPGLGVILKVEGAQIAIADIYDRPLDQIHTRIMRYWRPEFSSQKFDEIMEV